MTQTDDLIKLLKFRGFNCATDQNGWLFFYKNNIGVGFYLRASTYYYFTSKDNFTSKCELGFPCTYEEVISKISKTSFKLI